MAGLNVLVAVIVAFMTQDGAFSCTLQIHKSGSSLGPSSESDSSSTPHHTPALCGPSLGQHRDALKKIPGALPDLTSTSHHSPVRKSHHTPCDVPPGASPCSSSEHLLNLPNISASRKPLVTSTPPVPVPTSIVTPTDYNQPLLNLLIKLLSLASPVNNALLGTQIQSASPSVLPSKPTSNIGSVPVPVVPIPHSTSSSSASISSSSSGSSNVLPSQPCGLPSTVTPVPSLQLPVTPPTPTSFSTIRNNLDLTNFLLKLSSLVPVPVPLPASKLTPLSPLCPLFTPTLNTNSVSAPISKPKVSCNPSATSLGIIPSGTLPGIPCSSSIPKFSDSKPAQIFEGVSNPVPEEFPVSVTERIPISTLVSALASAPTPAPISKVNTSTFSGHNPAVINAFLKYFLSTQVPKLNTTSVNPHIASSTCATSPGSNSCSSSVLPSLSNASKLPTEFTPVTIKPSLIPVPPIPMLAPGINSGYNSAFIKHLIKHLLYHSAITPPPLSSSLSSAQSLANATPVPPPIPRISKPFLSSSSNGKLSALNHGAFDILPNKSSVPALAPITNPNAPSTNNSAIVSLLCKLLLSSSVSKTTPLSLNPDAMSMGTLDTTQGSPLVPNPPPQFAPLKSPFDSLSEVLSKFPNILSGSTMPFPGLIPIPIIPLSLSKPFPEPVPNIIPETPMPTHLPLLSCCHQKHLRPHHSTIRRPFIPPLPPLCSLSHSKLSSGCKNV